MRSILKCSSCNIYTMKEICPVCGRKSTNPKPPKYSPDDKYGMYRRKAKFESLKQAGLI